MNIRKPIDYSVMYTDLDQALERNLPQMELYLEIGKLVSARKEKGAAVAAAEYLAVKCPDNSGFSPRNLRRMRDFFRTYETTPDILKEALLIGWTQNVVIMEADLAMDQRHWYLRAVLQFGWSKAELLRQISDSAHETINLDISADTGCTENKISRQERPSDKESHSVSRQYLQDPIGRVYYSKSDECCLAVDELRLCRFQTYETAPDILCGALMIGWTQNMIILEADPSLDQWNWHHQATLSLIWSKVEPLQQIGASAYEKKSHNILSRVSYHLSTQGRGDIGRNPAPQRPPGCPIKWAWYHPCSDLFWLKRQSRHCWKQLQSNLICCHHCRFSPRCALVKLLLQSDSYSIVATFSWASLFSQSQLV